MPVWGKTGLPFLPSADEAQEVFRFIGIYFILCSSCEVGFSQIPEVFFSRLPTVIMIPPPPLQNVPLVSAFWRQV